MSEATVLSEHAASGGVEEGTHWRRALLLAHTSVVRLVGREHLVPVALGLEAVLSGHARAVLASTLLLESCTLGLVLALALSLSLSLAALTLAAERSLERRNRARHFRH